MHKVEVRKKVAQIIFWGVHAQGGLHYFEFYCIFITNFFENLPEWSFVMPHLLPYLSIYGSYQEPGILETNPRNVWPSSSHKIQN